MSKFAPIKHRSVARGGRQWVGNFPTMQRKGCGEFALTALADGIGERAREVAEEWEGMARSPFFAYEHERRTRLQEQHDEGRGQGVGFRQCRQPLAFGTIADLVMVLQEIHETHTRQGGAIFPPRFASSVPRDLALVSEALREAARNVRAGILIIAVIARAFAGEQNVPGVVIVVVPLRAVSAWRCEKTRGIVVVFEHEMNMPVALLRETPDRVRKLDKDVRFARLDDSVHRVQP